MAPILRCKPRFETTRQIGIAWLFAGLSGAFWAVVAGLDGLACGASLPVDGWQLGRCLDGRLAESG